MKNKLLLLLAFSIAVSAIRLLPHPANFIPIGAFALFIANKFESKYTIVFALLPMILSDIFLGFGWYSPFVYAGFLGYFIAGKYVKGYWSLAGAGVLSSIWFFIISNIGVWVGPWYPHTISGFIDCFVKAIPFYRNTLAGDMVYLASFYGAYELYRMASVNLNKNKELKWHTKS